MKGQENVKEPQIQKLGVLWAVHGATAVSFNCTVFGSATVERRVRETPGEATVVSPSAGLFQSTSNIPESSFLTLYS